MGLFKTANVVSRADKISNFTVSTAEYGSAVMEVLGTTRISGNVIYYDDFTAHEHRETQRSGKGGGVKSTTITYTYTAAVIMGLCEGPISNIGRVWINKELYQYPSDKIGMTLFSGTSEQQPWPYVVGKHPEKALPYTGLAYMAGVVDLGSNASLPNYNFEIKGKLLDTGDGIDVNPADYIRYILDKAGLQNVEIVGLDNYRKYCREADFLISTPSDYTSAKTARDIVNEIVSLTNAYMFWSNDRFKVVPKADRPVGSWKPNRQIAYDLTADDFLEQSNGACITCARKDSSELHNRFTIEFYNRENAYEKESVSYEDNDNIACYGLRQASTVSAHYIYTKKRAVMLAEELARRNKYERNKYTFKLDWAFCRLEPGDLVTLTDNNIGLNKQVAIIDSVTEDSKGILTFTAISRASGDYSEALYDVHEVDRPYIDFNAESGSIDAPLIFQPPSDLTSNGNELWVAAKGKKDTWGGCVVYISDNNVNYRKLGTITNNARLGTLARTMKAQDTACEVKINGTLISGTEQDAQRANTLCWLDGECLSYTTATMLQNGNYKLSGLVRGQYNTVAAAHDKGAKFVRCDETLLKSPLKKEDVGKKLWIKFTSYNTFGAREQSLADVEPYKYTVLPYYIPPVQSVQAHNRYRELHDGVSRYDIVVDWKQPDFANYLQGDVWYKTSNGQSDEIVLAEGIAADRLGYNGPWIFGGAGKDQVVIPQAIVGDSYLIAVCTKDEYGLSNSPDTAPQTEILVALKTTTPNTPDGFGVTFGAASILSWDEVTNTDIVFYEIRYDQHPGTEDGNLIVRTNGTNASVTLNARSGTLYLYAKSAIGKYSTPAVLKYNKALPPKPALLSATARLGGMSIAVGNIPSGCNGVNFHIDDSILIQSKNTTITHYCEAGIHSIAAAYTDIFGEGPKSDNINCTVKIKVDNALIEKETLTYDRMAPTAKEAISNASVDKINIAVRGILGNGSALILQNDEYALVASNGEKLAGLFVNSNGAIRLDGKYIHITGETVFDNNIISNAMLQAKSISADKLAAETINLGGALKVVGGAVTLSGDGLKVAETDGSYTMFDYTGVSFFDEYGKKYAMVKKQIIGTAQDGQYVKFTNPWKHTPKIICTPIDLASYVDTYDGYNTVVQCFAYNITNKGFYVRCRSILTAGTSGGEILLNKSFNSYRKKSDGTLEYTNSYTIPVTLPANIDININITIGAYGGYQTYKEYDPVLERYIKYTIWGNTGCRVKLYVNNVLVDTSIDVKAENNNKKYYDTTLHAKNIPISATITLIAESWLINGNESPANCSVTVKTITSNMAIETVASTGRASFIALENSDDGYSVMDPSEVTT